LKDSTTGNPADPELQEGQLAVLYPCRLEPCLTALMGKAEDTSYTSSQAITEEKDVFLDRVCGLYDIASYLV
jgi:hypothetical protein